VKGFGEDVLRVLLQVSDTAVSLHSLQGLKLQAHLVWGSAQGAQALCVTTGVELSMEQLVSTGLQALHSSPMVMGKDLIPQVCTRTDAGAMYSCSMCAWPMLWLCHLQCCIVEQAAVGDSAPLGVQV
jgi:hypothetical protein